MNRKCGLLIIASIVISHLASPAHAVDCYFYPPDYPNVTGGNWGTPQYWDPQIPGVGDRAVIGEHQGELVIVQCYVTDERQVGSLLLHGGCNTRLLIGHEGKLTVYQNSRIDGDGIERHNGACIEFYRFQPGAATSDCGAGELCIGADLTIAGDGGQILGNINSGQLENPPHCTQGSNPGIITSANVGGLPALLTLQSDGQRPLQVHGYIDIRAKLFNNARVGVEGVHNVMKLSRWPKTGSGEWYSAGGRLEVHVPVTWNAMWRLYGDDNDDNVPLIWINAACTELAGNVEVSRGKLQVDEDFCTTGDLILQGVNNPQAPYPGSRISVSAGKSAQFSGSCP
ncbi:MAG TPA: hypothetical protein PKK06_00010 [Phycisphaerae bacterium]|nr:hypothetical protein [Phycisphaerae bacterium]HNU44006.1 hypothetical protein [Phycisphaerae bacterium]